MTAAFLASETALADIDSAVQVAHQLDPRSRVRADWTALRERYGQVTAEYLRLSGAAAADPPPRADEFARCTDALVAMTDQMARFGQAHARELDRARHAVTELGVLDQRARTAATSAGHALEQAPASFMRLTSVSQAADGLSGAIGAYEQATDLPARRSTANALISAAQRVDTALSAAPGFTERAQRVIRSVDTRRGGIVTRAERVPETMSALRREFSGECSADLQTAEAGIRRNIEAAEADLARARERLADAPDQAIADAENARDDLDAAEFAVDSVLSRLELLRQVRADPAATEQRVRFRLRDAQHLAMNSNLVDEWGSVLDAQADRISRAHTRLERVHPDYWAYLTELRAVEDRVAEIVNRMRGQVAAR
ncbi:hypothetical protein GYA93_14465 [Gordonia desulfuricans]|uniref:Molecular chaperone DnaJ n=1 Tax=Gordonia desulfuricans TaxID=89051 RepID=A0A7K3LRQ2_9ACTN|nr:hypothetical protein [Gordonia desulfuricans]NDK90776.1 hypothetical protein [Gordonia desulfuricans]